MAITASVKKTGKEFDKLVKGINDLNDEYVEAGHFDEQGTHYSGYTFPELMALHHNPEGNGFDAPPRPVLDILFHRFEKLDSLKIKRVLANYRKMAPTPSNNKKLLSELGRLLVREEKSIFGSDDLAPNADYTVRQKGFDAPLVDTSSLKRKVAHKTSKNKKVEEG